MRVVDLIFIPALLSFWYVRVNLIPCDLTSPLAGPPLILVALIAFKRIPVSKPGAEDLTSAAKAALLLIATLGLLVLAGVLLIRFRDWLFPRGAFLFGQGKTRFQHLERIQWTVVIGFSVSFLASLVIWIWQLLV